METQTLSHHSNSFQEVKVLLKEILVLITITVNFNNMTLDPNKMIITKTNFLLNFKIMKVVKPMVQAKRIFQLLNLLINQHPTIQLKIWFLNCNTMTSPTLPMVMSSHSNVIPSNNTLTSNTNIPLRTNSVVVPQISLVNKKPQLILVMLSINNK